MAEGAEALVGVAAVAGRPSKVWVERPTHEGQPFQDWYWPAVMRNDLKREVLIIHRLVSVFSMGNDESTQSTSSGNKAELQTA